MRHKRIITVIVIIIILNTIYYWWAYHLPLPLSSAAVSLYSASSPQLGKGRQKAGRQAKQIIPLPGAD